MTANKRGRPAEMKDGIPITMWLPRTVVRWLDRLARRRRMSRSALVREMLTDSRRSWS